MITLIAAQGRGGAIGRDNDIPWRLPEDLKHFQRVTTGHPVIMGRKTWESLGSKPLKNRINTVISRTPKPLDGAFCCESLHDAILISEPFDDELFVIGGSAIYEEAMPIADRLIISDVDTDVADADRFFPAIDPAVWECVSETPHHNATIPFTVREYLRKDR